MLLISRICRRNIPFKLGYFRSSSVPMSKPCPYKILSDEVKLRGKWLAYREVGFLDPKTGKEAVWQCAFRTTKPASAPVDGVDIVPVLVHPDGTRSFVLIKQYRIPIDGWCLEFPAGLVDADESVETAAKREMLEETGYTISKLLIPPTKGKQMLDPGMSNDSIQFVTAEIDGSAPENQNPKQDLKDGEVIDVVLVPCHTALSYLEQTVKEGVHIEAIVYSFVLGFNLASKF